MKHLFLTSQGYLVIGHIAKQLGDKHSLPMVVITTAAEERQHSWVEKNRQELDSAGFNYDEYSITGKSVSEITEDLVKYQLLYMLGGNTFYLLEQIQKSACADYLKERIKGGLIYLGYSAGSILAGPDVHSANRPGKSASDYQLSDTKGLNLVNFVVMPHWGDPDKKEAYLESRIQRAYDSPYPYLLLNNHQYVEVKDDWYRIVDVTIS